MNEFPDDPLSGCEGIMFGLLLMVVVVAGVIIIVTSVLGAPPVP